MIQVKQMKQQEGFSDRLVSAIRKRYTPLLLWVLRKQKWVLSSILLLFIISFIVFGKLGAEFIPSLDEVLFSELLPILEEVTASISSINMIVFPLLLSAALLFASSKTSLGRRIVKRTRKGLKCIIKSLTSLYET